MTNKVPPLEVWSNALANEMPLKRQLATEETALRTEARNLIALQGKDNNRRARAEMIAAGETPDAALATPQLDATLSKLGDVELAIKIHRDKMQKIRLDEGKRLCLELKPSYDVMAKRLAAALVEVYAADSDIFELKSGLMSQGIGFYPVVCNLDTESVFGSPNDKSTNFARLLRECVKYGFLKELPKALK